MLSVQNLLRNETVKSGYKFVLAGSFKSAVSVVVLVISLRWLLPQELGLWSALSIFLAYLPFLQMGIQTSLKIDLAVLVGKKEEHEALKLVQNAKGFAWIIFGGILFIGTIVALFLVLAQQNTKMIWGTIAIALIAATQTLQLHFNATYRSAKAFDRLANINWVETVLTLILSICIYYFSFYGLLLFNVGKMVLITFLMYCYDPYRKSGIKLKINTLLGLAKSGLVLMSFIQIRTAAQSIPRWIILAVGSVTELGLFYPANSINLVMNLVPVQISHFFQPQMGFIYGKTGKAKDMWRYIRLMLWIFPLVSLPLAGLIWWLTPYVLENYFPKYLPSLWAIRWMSVGFVFSSAIITHMTLYTIKAYKQAHIYSIVEFIGYLVFPLLAIYLFHIKLVEAVAIGYAINNAIIYLLNAYILRKTLFLSQFNLEKIELNESCS